jgi:hypothetical protein
MMVFGQGRIDGKEDTMRVASVLMGLGVVAVVTAGSTYAAPPATWFYQDDFETNKAIQDSYWHSWFCLEEVCSYCISLSGFLCYGPGWQGRGLWFCEGFEVEMPQPFLAYACVAEDAVCTSGFVSFWMGGYGMMEVYGSRNGSSWTLLGVATAPGSEVFPLEPDDPVQFIRFIGYEAAPYLAPPFMDDLWMMIHYRLPGDLNCDGEVNSGDINPFVLGYNQQFPDCDIMLADINGDGAVDFGDINPFVALVAGGGA